MARSRRLRGSHLTELVRAADPLPDAALVASPDDPEARTAMQAIIDTSDQHNGKHETFSLEKRSRVVRWPLSFAAAGVAVALTVVTLLSTMGTTEAMGAVLLQSVDGVPVEANLPASVVHNGRIDWSKVPEFVSAQSHGVAVGYVRKSDLRHPLRLGGPMQGPIPSCDTEGVKVYDGGNTVVGHIYPDAGYTPLGVRPRCPAPLPPSTAPPPGVSLNGPGGAGGAAVVPGVLVPDVRNEPVDRATRELQAVGFLVKVVLVATSGRPPGTVVSEAPEPGHGARLTRGSEVVLSVAS